VCVSLSPERLVEALRLPQVPILHAQVFLFFRVLLLRMSPQHLTSLWPTMITELVRTTMTLGSLHLDTSLSCSPLHIFYPQTKTQTSLQTNTHEHTQTDKYTQTHKSTQTLHTGAHTQTNTHSLSHSPCVALQVQVFLLMEQELTADEDISRCVLPLLRRTGL